ncbi:MAG: hypothetical protein JNK82_37700, partial [Myxococcaceae bacterium]|nr:hypothetical protein [Myxococcaceae bacterium]
MLIYLVLALTSAAPETRRVYAGVYLSDVSDFDLKAGRFKADLRVWLKWSGDEKAPNVTFENGEIDSKDELGTEADGSWRSVKWRVQGTFRSDFPVNAFPFDHQTLPVVLGLEESEGVLVPDLGASGMNPTFSITGWNYEPYFNARSEVKRYGSDLGSIEGEGKAARLNRAAFTVEMNRPFAPYLIKFALPLALILLMALLALFLPPTELEVRSAMGVTALLACIAFHYTQADTLPDVTYLVAADKLFLGAYVFITATMLITVVAFLSHERRPGFSRRADRLGLFGLPGVALVSTLTLIAGALRAHPVDAAVEQAGPRPSQPVLKVGVAMLDSVQSGGLPPRRGQLVVRGAKGALLPSVAEDAPAMTNSFVRLLPDGGMRVRWKVPEAARFSDGSPVSSADLVFSIGTVPNPQRTGVDVVDEHTVDVTYAARRNEWLSGFSVYPQGALERAFNDGGREALQKASNEPKTPSAGPYALTGFTAGSSATLERNPHFAGPRPIFERIEVTVLKDPVKAAEALLAREVDVLPSISGATYEALRGKSEVKVLEQPGDLLWVLVPSLKSPPWDSVAARRALLAALDREAMVKVLEPAPAHVAGSWSAAARAPKPAAGPGLKELGLEGATVKLHVSPQKVKASAGALLAERVVADLTKAGLKVEVEEHTELSSFTQKRDFEGLVLIGRDAGEPSRFFNVAFDSGRYVTETTEGSHYDAAMREAFERRQASLYDERRAA